jgi:alcohol dehydrogenase
MKAALYEEFQKPVKIENVSDPVPSETGVVIRVKATGICRSDWHGWMGHDPDIKKLPHVPGHELAGTIEEVGKKIVKWKKGDRVTIPFVCGCGYCPQCKNGNHQICDNQFQPGFTHWGSFAEFVSIEYADINLVKLPDDLNFITAASLGCRFATSFRAVKEIGRVAEGQWLVVHGCGGIGLSAIMIGKALGANVIGVDISEDKLNAAVLSGADAVINANETGNVVEAVFNLSNGGAHVSIDALGSKITCNNSISCLRKRGKHIQVGLMAGKESDPQIPMAKVISRELEIHGSHGMQSYKYQEMFGMIEEGKLDPGKLIGKVIGLEDSLTALTEMNKFNGAGVTVINMEV